jgi:hypothetical protein
MIETTIDTSANQSDRKDVSALPLLACLRKIETSWEFNLITDSPLANDRCLFDGTWNLPSELEEDGQGNKSTVEAFECGAKEVEEE